MMKHSFRLEPAQRFDAGCIGGIHLNRLAIGLDRLAVVITKRVGFAQTVVRVP